MVCTSESVTSRIHTTMLSPLEIMTDTCAHLLLQTNLFVFLEYFEELDFIVFLQPRGERQVAVFPKSTTSLLCPPSLLFRLSGQNDRQLLLLTSWGGAVSSQDMPNNVLTSPTLLSYNIHNCPMIFATVNGCDMPFEILKPTSLNCFRFSKFNN